jgi:predicted nucleic acid-binding protein
MQNAVNNLPITGDYVLDSFALIAYFGAESGGQQVRVLLEAASEGKCHLYMCVVNLGEVMYIVERKRGLPKAQETLARIDELPIDVINADRALTLAAAHIKMNCPIPYADCFAAALSKVKNASLVTGDPEFSKIEADSNLNVDWLVK